MASSDCRAVIKFQLINRFGARVKLQVFTTPGTQKAGDVIHLEYKGLICFQKW